MVKIISAIFLFNLLLSTQILAANKTIVIVGGGIAGVATTGLIAETNRDAKIVLLEKEPKIGGNARTLHLPTENGKMINVDIGPQYISKGAWDHYIAFLKYFKLWNDKEWIHFRPTLSIFKDTNSKPDFFTPEASIRELQYINAKNGFHIPDPFRMLYTFTKANKSNNDSSVTDDITIGDFLDTLKVKKEFISNVILPIIASGSVLEIPIIRSVAMNSVNGVMFAESPLRQKFMISKVGLGNNIIHLGERIKGLSKNVEILTSSPAIEVKKNADGKFNIRFGLNGEKTIVADVLIFATHPDQAKRILANDPSFNEVTNVLGRFPYIKNRVVVHKDTSILNKGFETFYNIYLKTPNHYNMSMRFTDLGVDYKHIYKSWGFSEEEFQEMKRNNKIIATSEFYHPYVTPEFLKNNTILKTVAAKTKNLYFVGGWTEKYETQDTSIISGFRILNKISPNSTTYWKSRIRKFKDLPEDYN